MEDGDYLYVCILVWLLIGNFKIGPSIPRISFCFKPVSVLTCYLFRIQLEMKSISIRLRLFIVYVWLYAVKTRV